MGSRLFFLVWKWGLTWGQENCGKGSHKGSQLNPERGPRKREHGQMTQGLCSGEQCLYEFRRSLDLLRPPSPPKKRLLSGGDSGDSLSHCLSGPGAVLRLETLVMFSKLDGISRNLDLDGVWLGFGAMVGGDWVLSAPHRPFSVISAAAENPWPEI